MEKYDVTARLEMVPHPAGGYYQESYKSAFSLPYQAHPGTPKPMASSIYYLLGEEDSCLFHSSTSEEVWSFLYGYPIDLYLLYPEGNVSIITIGSNLSIGETPQLTVAPNQIFGMKLHGRQKPGHNFLAYSPEPFALLTCLSIPGFTKGSIRYFSQEEVSSLYPNCQDLSTFY